MLALSEDLAEILLELGMRLQQMVRSGIGFAVPELLGSVVAVSASNSMMINALSSHRWRYSFTFSTTAGYLGEARLRRTRRNSLDEHVECTRLCRAMQWHSNASC
jgi:RsiW-degrading membrane proteinase PrsW (M82 family)